MPSLIDTPTQIPVPGGKLIEEYVGRVNSGETAVSIARMDAPGGWTEPFQSPDFDEFTLVLRGSVQIEHDGGVLEVAAGQAVVTGRRADPLQHEGRRRICRRLPAGLRARAREA